jgi:hypothetical protein
MSSKVMPIAALFPALMVVGNTCHAPCTVRNSSHLGGAIYMTFAPGFPAVGGK